MNIEINKDFIKKLDETFHIGDSYSWEGSANVFFNGILIGDNQVSLNLNVSGNSLIEHDGDKRGIVDQVWDLRDSISRIEWNGSEYTVKIVNTSCKITGEPHGDDDYSVQVNGIVTLKIR